MDSGPRLILAPSLLRFLDAILAREWLVTNGLGGYASGTVAGANTRRYHGLLVAALDPPVRRTVLVAKVDETVEADGRPTELGTNEYHDDTVAPQGYRCLSEFCLAGTIPMWTYRASGVILEKSIWMAREANTTYVRYRLLRGSRPARLLIRPYLTARDHHGTTRGDPAQRFGVTVARLGASRTGASSAGRTAAGVGVRIEPPAGTGVPPYVLAVSAGRFATGPIWFWKFLHRVERARGLDDLEDLFVPGQFEVDLKPGKDVTLVATADSSDASLRIDRARAFRRERARQGILLKRAKALPADPVAIPGDGGLPHRLVLAADQFLVRGTTRRTVIAGYHWFADWGRDTMIALPGLTLATGRPGEAREILQAFAGLVDQGMLPNRFPDTGAPAEYTSADASLLYFVALHRYLERSKDKALLRSLFPVLREIVDRYGAGTRHGIRVDPRDGLLEAGEEGFALTWMDAQVSGRAVTARGGKAVELNALWYNALRLMGRWAPVLKRDPDTYETEAERVRATFGERFFNPAGGYLYDLIRPDGTPDDAIRPNQLFALSLPYPLLEGERARSVLDVVSRELLTPFGLRSLAPGSPLYRGRYGGGPVKRDEAYHEGTVWPWLLGPYVAALLRVTGDREAARRVLEPFHGHLFEAGLGTVGEIFDGEPPFAPQGCIAQAWSVGALLEAWELVGEGPVRRGEGR